MKENFIKCWSLLASARQKFCILRGHNALRHELKMSKCDLGNSRPCEQMMAPIPSARISPCLPPLYVSMDYFGLILLKSRRSQEKRYGHARFAVRLFTLRLLRNSQLIHLFKFSQDLLADEASQLKFTATMELALKVLRLRSRPL